MQVCGAAKMMCERCGVPTEKRMEPTMPMTRNVTLCVLQQNVHLNSGNLEQDAIVLIACINAVQVFVEAKNSMADKASNSPEDADENHHHEDQ